MVRGYFAPRMHVRSDDEWMKGLQRRASQRVRLMAPESSEASPTGMDGNNSLLNVDAQVAQTTPPETESYITDITADTAASSEIERTSKPGRSHTRQGQNVSVLSSDVGGLRSDSDETNSDLTSSVQQRPSSMSQHVSFKAEDHLPFAGADRQVHESPEGQSEVRAMGLDGPQTEPPSEAESLSDEEPSSSEDHQPEFAPINATPIAPDAEPSSTVSEYETAQEEMSVNEHPDDHPDEDEELARLREGESSRAVRRNVQKFEQMRWREGAGRRRRKGYQEEPPSEGKKPWGWFGVKRATPTNDE